MSLNAAEIAAWTAEVEAWESDHSQPNPYEPKLKSLTQRDVRLHLAEEEKAEATRAAALGHIRSKLTAQKLLLQGLELEELQRKLRHDVHALGQHATSLQKMKTVEFGTSLQGRISRWTRNAEVHLLCIPSLAEVDAEAAPENTQVPPPYNLKIWMPSHICKRGQRCPRRHATFSAPELIPGKIEWVDQRIHGHVSQYRNAQTALKVLTQSLNKGGLWAICFRELSDEDVHPLPVDGLGEGGRASSWIWRVGSMGQGTSEEILEDALRIEWLKAHACFQHFDEEIHLLNAEKEQGISYLRFEVLEWAGRISAHNVQDQVLRDDLDAYAKQQAVLHLQWSARFEKMLADIPIWISQGTVPDNFYSEDTAAHPSSLGMKVT
ncbi:hypothetical protein FISHEDRAFT_74058 [Fistulina hepatica ATCC 64428]|uniref:C3H1-type domain-containing protein n=1 Tax=Fistulina hepatica ATCC 64428 TaxID=1128425 RepID=A0A0D7ADS8_9AGAR|nr:hypothetical protein FISHEDRAFT_74058 [Fistulina hepatica ATCC 64428]